MKLDLAKDKAKLRKYLQSRIQDYPIYVNLGPGEDEDPIALITVGFYAEQGGYVNVVFDTRRKAEVDGEWTMHIDNEVNTCKFPKWVKAYEAMCEGKPVAVTKPDGTTYDFKDADNEEGINQVFGEMLLDLMTELRDDGSLAKLPLAPKAFMVLEEFDGRYSWPGYKKRKTAGRIAK